MCDQGEMGFPIVHLNILFWRKDDFCLALSPLSSALGAWFGSGVESGVGYIVFTGLLCSVLVLMAPEGLFVLLVGDSAKWRWQWSGQ